MGSEDRSHNSEGSLFGHEEAREELHSHLTLRLSIHRIFTFMLHLHIPEVMSQGQWQINLLSLNFMAWQYIYKKNKTIHCT
jgi:hypothetical protein